MATPTNRSPWQVKLHGKEPTRFRLKSQALAHLAELGYKRSFQIPQKRVEAA